MRITRGYLISVEFILICPGDINAAVRDMIAGKAFGNYGKNTEVKTKLNEDPTRTYQRIHNTRVRVLMGFSYKFIKPYIPT